MAQYFSCGFMKVKVLDNFENIRSNSTSKEDRFNNFKNAFNHLEVDFKHFNRKSDDLHNFYRRHRWGGEDKKMFTNFYSLSKWNKLSEEDKGNHKLNRCDACSKNKKINSLFPITGKRKKGGRPKPFNNNNVQIEIPVIETANRRHAKAYEKEAAKIFITDASKCWENVYETPLTEVLRKVTALTPRKTSNEKRIKERATQRVYKKHIENIFEQKDVETFLGTRESASGYEKRRRNLFLEPKEKAIQRFLANKRK